MEHCSISLRIPILIGTVLLYTWVHGAGQQSTDGDAQWPLAFSADGYEVRVYAPQPESISGDRFVARMAVSLQNGTSKAPVFGAVWGDGSMAVDRSTRLGRLVGFEVNDVRFPEPLAGETETIRTMLTREIPRHAEPIPIDWLVAALESEIHDGSEYANDAPEIIYRERPAVLLFIDGEPQYLVLERKSGTYGDPLYNGVNTDIERVLNTPFMLLRYKRKDHYLHGSDRWFKASEVRGPYVLVKDPPEALRELAAEVYGLEPVGRVPGSEPEVVVRNTPAVLLDLDGPPLMKPLQGTNLLYATNTDKDLFLDIATQEHYLLASGRWYVTRSPRDGPWYHVPGTELPADFSQIPEGSPKDAVLPHVPGTLAAREAVRDARIPQTALVDRRTATIEVKYQGDPLFERIDGTQVELAVNANSTVLRINGRYHACENAVWYESDRPDGPWEVSVEVPADVQDIPPESPAYNVRYVDVYNHDDETVVTGYTPGYLGCYVQGGVVIMGTGYYYPYWPGYWYPRPFTWGFNMYYDPWIGWTFGWNWGWNWYYPGWVYGPWYGALYPWYGWGPWGWWGPWYYCPPWPVDPRPVYYGHRPSIGSGASPSTASQANLYNVQPRPGVTPAVVGRATTVGGEEKTPDPGPIKPLTGPDRKGGDRDHFADPDGNIYRRDGQRIERYDRGLWQRMPRTQPQVLPRPLPPRTDPYGIGRDRDRGVQRLRDLDNYKQRIPQWSPSPTPSPRRQDPQRKP